METDESVKVRDFKEAVIALCRATGLSISHEDSQGAFQVVPYDDFYSVWFADARWKELNGVH